MSKVTILLAPTNMWFLAYKAHGVVNTIRESLALYTEGGTFECEETGEKAAEEAFDLTNNPSRQNERERIYGRGRSVSSGDVIDVDGVKYACLSIGWQQL